MAHTVALGSRVDSRLKSEFDETATELGLSPSAALTVLMKRFVDDGGFPFEVRLKSRVAPFASEEEADAFIDAAGLEMLDEAR